MPEMGHLLPSRTGWCHSRCTPDSCRPVAPPNFGSTRPHADIRLLRVGGHFAGGTILHWRAAAEGKGALLVGDIATVTMDRRFVSFMYSYPNYIPLDAAAVRRTAEIVAPLAFDRIYGAWWDRTIASGGKPAFDASVKRYLAAIAAKD